MSGVLLTAQSARLLPTLEPDASVAAALFPGPATSQREFPQGDTVNIFAEVYDNIPARDAHRVDITTTLLGETGREAFRSTQTLGRDPQNKGKSVILGYATSIPLNAIAPGRYLLRIEAAARGTGNVNDAKPVARETLVTVLPAR